jgi:hypothetical protein
LVVGGAFGADDLDGALAGPFPAGSLSGVLAVAALPLDDFEAGALPTGAFAGVFTAGDELAPLLASAFDAAGVTVTESARESRAASITASDVPMLVGASIGIGLWPRGPPKHAAPATASATSNGACER